MEEQRQVMEEEITHLEKEIKERETAEKTPKKMETENVRLTEKLSGRDETIKELRTRAESLESKLADIAKKPTA